MWAPGRCRATLPHPILFRLRNRNPNKSSPCNAGHARHARFSVVMRSGGLVGLSAIQTQVYPVDVAQPQVDYPD